MGQGTQGGSVPAGGGAPSASSPQPAACVGSSSRLKRAGGTGGDRVGPVTPSGAWAVPPAPRPRSHRYGRTHTVLSPFGGSHSLPHIPAHAEAGPGLRSPLLGTHRSRWGRRPSPCPLCCPLSCCALLAACGLGAVLLPWRGLAGTCRNREKLRARSPTSCPPPGSREPAPAKAGIQGQSEEVAGKDLEQGMRRRMKGSPAGSSLPAVPGGSRGDTLCRAWQQEMETR